MKSNSISKELLISFTDFASVTAMLILKRFNIYSGTNGSGIRACTLDLLIARNSGFSFIFIFCALALALAVGAALSFLLKRVKIGILMSCLISLCETAVMFFVIFRQTGRSGELISVNAEVFFSVLLSFASCFLPLSLFSETINND